MRRARLRQQRRPLTLVHFPAHLAGALQVPEGAHRQPAGEEARRACRWGAARARAPNSPACPLLSLLFQIGRITWSEEGVSPSLEYRLRFWIDDDKLGRIQISPWHDVP